MLRPLTKKKKLKYTMKLEVTLTANELGGLYLALHTFGHSLDSSYVSSEGREFTSTRHGYAWWASWKTEIKHDYISGDRECGDLGPGTGQKPPG